MKQKKNPATEEATPTPKKTFKPAMKAPKTANTETIVAGPESKVAKLSPHVAKNSSHTAKSSPHTVKNTPQAVKNSSQAIKNHSQATKNHSQSAKRSPQAAKTHIRAPKLVQTENSTNLFNTPAPEQPAPLYEIPVKDENTKPASFSRLIHNDDILLALDKASYQVPSELLLSVLPATLRGSDTLIYKSQHPDGFLISAISTISKLSNSEDSEKKRNHPTALFLFPSQESLKSAFALTTEVFNNFKINFSCLEPAVKSSEDNTQQNKDFDPQNVDVLFGTPASILEAQKNNGLNSNPVQILCINALHMFEGADKDALNLCITSLANEDTQKIFISYQNTPKVREFAFKYLEDPEIFSFLPTSITEQYPRQFAHALEATQKFQVLLGYLKTYKPRAALVVANTKFVAEWIAFKLHGNNVKVSLLTSPVSPYQKRAEFLNSVASGDVHVFVTTDPALKNFGLEYINCVYHFDLPDNPNLYLERLNKIEGSRNPISIAFICEDYGFNMGKIEEKLGFKVRITAPDKNFFNFKDTSEYPLESSGRVKTIGQKTESLEQNVPEKQSVSQKVAEATLATSTAETQSTEPRTVRTDSKPQHVSIKPRSPDTKPRQADSVQHRQADAVQQRPSDVQTQPKQADAQARHTDTTSTQQRTPSRHHQPDTSKFVRRDERAREAVADALLAAKMAEEKRKGQESHKNSNTSQSAHTESKQESLFSSLLFVISEAFSAGAHATKESLIHNTEKRFPALHKFINRKK